MYNKKSRHRKHSLMTSVNFIPVLMLMEQLSRHYLHVFTYLHKNRLEGDIFIQGAFLSVVKGTRTWSSEVSFSLPPGHGERSSSLITSQCLTWFALLCLTWVLLLFHHFLSRTNEIKLTFLHQPGQRAASTPGKPSVWWPGQPFSFYWYWKPQVNQQFESG